MSKAMKIRHFSNTLSFAEIWKESENNFWVIKTDTFKMHIHKDPHCALKSKATKIRHFSFHSEKLINVFTPKLQCFLWILALQLTSHLKITLTSFKTVLTYTYTNFIKISFLILFFISYILYMKHQRISEYEKIYYKFSMKRCNQISH